MKHEIQQSSATKQLHIHKTEANNHSTDHLEMQDPTYLSTDEAGEGDGGVLASVKPVLVDMSNVDLNGSVILGGDGPVRRRTLPGNVEIHHLALLVLHFRFSPISQATIPARKNTIPRLTKQKTPS